jgi:hypothetical protein
MRVRGGEEEEIFVLGLQAKQKDLLIWEREYPMEIRAFVRWDFSFTRN